MLIRVATPADAKGIARVHVASWRTSYRGIVPDDTLAGLSVDQHEEMWRRGLTNTERKHMTLVAEAEERIVGFADFGPMRDDDTPISAGELYAIYLLADFQRRGVGRRLWEEIRSAAQHQSVSAIFVWVLADNHRARSFYEKCGFSRDGAKKTIQLGGRELREIRYRLDLAQQA